MNEQQNQPQLNANEVLEAYKTQLSDVTHDNILKDVYIKKLEAMVQHLERQVDELSTNVNK